MQADGGGELDVGGDLTGHRVVAVDGGIAREGHS